MDRSQKKQIISSMNQTFSEVDTVIVSHYHGLTVEQITNLRRSMRASGAVFKVGKNKLTSLAANETKFKNIAHLFKGPVAITCSRDPVSAAKILVEFAKKNNALSIIGGMVQNQVVDLKNIQTLATLPSLDELRSKVIGIISTPATRMACLLKEPAAQVARVVNAYASKEE